MNVKLKTKLLELKRSQISVAHEIGISEPHFSKIVNNWIIPGDRLKEKIANALRCSIEEIFPKEEKNGA